MATLKSYVVAMWERQTVIAEKLGADISRADKQTRVLNMALLVLLATVVKTLVDRGVVTDAGVLTVLNAARDATYDDEPVAPVDDPVLPGVLPFITPAP